MQVGVIAFAFGQARGARVTKSNRKIAEAARHLASTYNAPIVTQWEVALALDLCSTPVEVVSEYGSDTHYVPTKFVFEQGVAWLARHEVRHVILVGHPDHVALVKWLLRWRVWRLDPKMRLFSNSFIDSVNRSVPYDRSNMNIQRWTRSRMRFCWYVVKLLFGRRHGK